MNEGKMAAAGEAEGEQNQTEQVAAEQEATAEGGTENSGGISEGEGTQDQPAAAE